jgi:hypothetical protein
LRFVDDLAYFPNRKSTAESIKGVVFVFSLGFLKQIQGYVAELCGMTKNR